MEAVVILVKSDWDFPTIELATHIQSELHLGFSHFAFLFNSLHFPYTTATHHLSLLNIVLLPLSLVPPSSSDRRRLRFPTPNSRPSLHLNWLRAVRILIS
jgi:hypothetical protein